MTKLGKPAFAVIGKSVPVVTVAQAAAEQADPSVTRFTVSDSFAHVFSAIGGLGLLTKLSGINVTDANSASTAYSNYLANRAGMDKLLNFAIEATQVTVALAAKVQANTHIAHFQVADSASNLLAALPALSADSKLSQLSVSTGSSLTVAGAIFTQYQATLDKFASYQQLVVTGLTVAQAAAVQADANVTSFTVSDSFAHVFSGIAGLGLLGKLSGINVTDANSASTAYSNYLVNRAGMDKLVNFALEATNLTAAQAAEVQANAHIAHFQVTDSASNLLAALPALSVDTKLSQFNLSKGAVLNVAGSTYSQYRTTLDKASVLLVVSGLNAAQAATAQADSRVKSYTVSDTSAAVLGLDPRGISKLGSIHLTDAAITGGTHYATTFSATAYATSRTVIDKLDLPALVQAKVAQAATAQADQHVWSFAVADTAQNIAAGLAGFINDSHLTSIILTNATTLTISGATYTALHTQLASKLAAGTSLVVQDLTVAQAAAAQADSHVSGFTIKDAAAQVLASLDALNADSKLTGVTLGVGETLGLTYAQFNADKALVGKLAAHAATVSGVAADQAASVAGNSHVGHETVTDTLAHIGANLDALETLAKSKVLTSIAVSDTGKSITLTPAQYAADADAIKLMSGSFTINHPATGGFHIRLIYDAAAKAAPQAFRDSLEAAAHKIESLFSTVATINLKVGFGEIGGQALPSGVLGEGGPFFDGGSKVNVTWAQYKADLAAHATSADQLTAISNMTADPTHGGTIYISRAEAKALGLLSPNDTGLDGQLGFAGDRDGSLFTYGTTNGAAPGHYDFVGVAEHEITHALGRISLPFSPNSGNVGLDMFRYSAPGQHTLDPATRAYFSVDGGKTNLDWFSTSSDLADWDASAGNDANVAYSPPGVANVFTHADVVMMNVLGYALA